jgi:hypothetical protein
MMLANWLISVFGRTALGDLYPVMPSSADLIVARRASISHIHQWIRVLPHDNRASSWGRWIWNGKADAYRRPRSRFYVRKKDGLSGVITNDIVSRAVT